MGVVKMREFLDDHLGLFDSDQVPVLVAAFDGSWESGQARWRVLEKVLHLLWSARKSERTLRRAPASQDDLPATSSVYRGPGLLGLPGTLRSRCCSLAWLLEVAPWFGLGCANTKFVLS